MRLINGKLILKEDKVDEDRQIPGDTRTMMIIKEIADSLDDDITVTFDTPSNHNDGNVPILDIKCHINSENKVMYYFYKKPISSDFVTLKSAAMTMKQKFNILTQQCFFRLHNTIEDADVETKVEILNEFMKDLFISGYDEKDRKTILIGGINTYKNLKEKESQGIRPFYRPNTFDKKLRKLQKREKKINWFQGKTCDSKFKSVLYVEAMPGDTLLKMIKETEEKYKISEEVRLKIVSKSGYRLANLLQNKNPAKRNCGKDDCKLCEYAEKSGHNSMCSVNSVCYQAKCDNCEKEGRQRVYDGETSRTAYIRCLEHYEDLKKRKKNSWMWKHIESEHNGHSDDITFSWKVTKICKKPPRRQLYEAVRINRKKSDENLNTKHEYNGQRLRRLEVIQENCFDCKICGQLFKTFHHRKTHTEMFHEKTKCNQCEYEAFGQSGLKEHVRLSH